MTYQPRRYPIEPLLHIAEHRWQPNNERALDHTTPTGKLQQLVAGKWGRGSAHRWVRQGWISEPVADRIACELGSHIDIIWNGHIHNEPTTTTQTNSH